MSNHKRRISGFPQNLNGMRGWGTRRFFVLDYDREQIVKEKKMNSEVTWSSLGDLNRQVTLEKQPGGAADK